VLLILVCEYFIVLPAAFSLLQAPILVVRIWGVTLIVTLVAFIVILMRSGQGGARLMKSANGMPVGDRTADDCWIGGMIYVNRKDPALLVEKRMGIGWTLNFGNPGSWLLLLAIVAIPVLFRMGVPH